MTPRTDGLPECFVTSRSDAVYNGHAYLTKVPIAAIRPFIEVFSEPGELVVDFFAGSGMTGLAAVKAGRRAALSDISVLGKHIATGYLTRVDHQDLLREAARVVGETRDRLGNLYMTKRASDRTPIEMVRTIWSFTYECPSCSNLLVFFEHMSAAGSPPKICPKCADPFSKRLWGRAMDVPVQVVVRAPDGRQAEQAVCTTDRQRIKSAAQDPRLDDIPSCKIDESREMYSRSGLGKAGLTDTSSFFSPRNAIALLELWRAISSVDEAPLRQKLRFAFTAILARASRRYQWGPKRPLNAQNQTYYIAPIYYEWNVFELFDRKVAAAIRSDTELFGEPSPLWGSSIPDASYSIASAERLTHLKDASVDYVFTDPPFGSNIFYSDMNLFHEAWLGEYTDSTTEAVVHTTGRKKIGAAERYESLLRSSFLESYRVLKHGKYMSVVFGNSSGAIWGLVQRALRESGFDHRPVHVAVLDKGQRSVKGLNSGSESVVTVDLILTVRKPNQYEVLPPLIPANNTDPGAMIRKAVSNLDSVDATNPSHVYAKVLREAIHMHVPLDHLHLSDVLIALRDAGLAIDAKTGKILARSHRPS